MMQTLLFFILPFVVFSQLTLVVQRGTDEIVFSPPDESSDSGHPTLLTLCPNDFISIEAISERNVEEEEDMVVSFQFQGERSLYETDEFPYCLGGVSEGEECLAWQPQAGFLFASAQFDQVTEYSAVIQIELACGEPQPTDENGEPQLAFKPTGESLQIKEGSKTHIITNQRSIALCPQKQISIKAIGSSSYRFVLFKWNNNRVRKVDNAPYCITAGCGAWSPPKNDGKMKVIFKPQNGRTVTKQLAIDWICNGRPASPPSNPPSRPPSNPPSRPPSNPPSRPPSTPPPSGGKGMCFEMESVSLPSTWRKETKSGRTFVRYIGPDHFKGDRINSVPSGRSMTYSVTLPQKGNYKFSCVAKQGTKTGKHDLHNDIWLKLPGLNHFEKALHNKDWSDSLRWNPNHKGWKPIYRNFNAGRQSVVIAGRSNDFSIDRCCFTLQTGNANAEEATDLDETQEELDFEVEEANEINEPQDAGEVEEEPSNLKPAIIGLSVAVGLLVVIVVVLVVVVLKK